ncbi:MAG: hypothetical protein B6I37_05425 [Desulfobacteraceae bacterium 4572_35.2]|nr:MAG: hypothetical protein B6I37_05425 [Desulfobacteraceae bacterium 4572_35.2]
MTFLTLLTIALISTLLYSPIPEQFLASIQIAAIATPTLLLILQMLTLDKSKQCNTNLITYPANANS